MQNYRVKAVDDIGNAQFIDDEPIIIVRSQKPIVIDVFGMSTPELVDELQTRLDSFRAEWIECIRYEIINNVAPWFDLWRDNRNRYESFHFEMDRLSRKYFGDIVNEKVIMMFQELADDFHREITILLYFETSLNDILSSVELFANMHFSSIKDLNDYFLRVNVRYLRLYAPRNYSQKLTVKKKREYPYWIPVFSCCSDSDSDDESDSDSCSGRGSNTS
jgi:hypothetical protein